MEGEHYLKKFKNKLRNIKRMLRDPQQRSVLLLPSRGKDSP